MSGVDRNQPAFGVCGAWRRDQLMSGVVQLIHAMARETHPDVGGDPEQFRLVTEAYQQARAAV